MADPGFREKPFAVQLAGRLPFFKDHGDDVGNEQRTFKGCGDHKI